MAVQLPIIWLIWRAILLAGEQIHLSPGFLWVPDLSLHDPYFILVILTTAVMLLQQWMMTPKVAVESSPGAKWMGYIFPIVMAIMLWKFPAGLWLYYMLTTAVQVVQQEIVNRQMKRAARLAPATDTLGEISSETKGDGDGGTWTS
jgi:YidC/Oxa1 family membrane protein insertase